MFRTPTDSPEPWYSANILHDMKEPQQVDDIAPGPQPYPLLVTLGRIFLEIQDKQIFWVQLTDTTPKQHEFIVLEVLCQSPHLEDPNPNCPW